MITYSIHVAVLLTICFLFYKLLLQKETYYQLNRVLLLVCLVLSFILPLIPVPQQFSFRGQDVWQINAVVPTVVNQNNAITANPGIIAQPTIVRAPSTIPATDNSLQLNKKQLLKGVFWFYWCVVAVFAANFLLQIIVILYQAYKKPVIRDGFYRIIELEGDKAPCSFGNNIFINPAKYDWETYKQILMHEKIHIQQGHSFDLLLAELMLILQWFNPFAWLYRKELEMNLEYLTDDAIINRHKVEAEVYQLSLLKVSVPNYSVRVTTNYNQSLLKKRIVMMNAKRSNIHTSWKYFLLMPLLGALVCILNEPVALSSPIRVKNKLAVKIPKAVPNPVINFQPDTIKKKKPVVAKLKSIDTKTKPIEIKPNRVTSAVIANLSDEIDIDPAYLKSLHEIGYNTKSPKDITALQKADITAGDIKPLMEIGYKDLSVNTLLALNRADITAGDIKPLMEIGYRDLSLSTLIALNKADITAGDIKPLMSIGYSDLSVNTLIALNKADISAGDIKPLMSIGYRDLSLSTLIALDKADITAGDIKSLMSIGYTDLSVPTLIALDKADIGAGDIKPLMSIGYTDLSLKTLLALNAADITAGDIKPLMSIGYKDLSVSTLIALDKADISAQFIKGFMEIGYKDLSVATLLAFAAADITPQYIKGFMEIGYKDLSVKTLIMFDKADITPAFIKTIPGYTDMAPSKIKALKEKE